MNLANVGEGSGSLAFPGKLNQCALCTMAQFVHTPKDEAVVNSSFMPSAAKSLKASEHTSR